MLEMASSNRINSNSQDDDILLNDNRLDEPLQQQQQQQQHLSPRRRRIHASTPSLFWNGPPHALSWSWTYKSGAENLAILFWIGKDWSWSQLGWTNTAFSFGTAAAIWMATTTVLQYRRQGLVSECYKGLVNVCWLFGLYAWMTDDLWTLWFSNAHKNLVIDEDLGQEIAKWALLLCVLLYTIFFAILVPLDVFAVERQSPVVQRLQESSPPCPWPSYFHEFRLYASLHYYTWVLKDCMWAWELPTAYFCAFIITVLLNLDILRRLARHHYHRDDAEEQPHPNNNNNNKQNNTHVEFWNYVVILLWVIANGFWAFGELVANATATEEQFRRYSWPHWHVIRGATFHFRYTAGWIFLTAVLCLIFFYTHWIVLTLQNKLPTLQDFENDNNDHNDQDDAASLVEEANHEQQDETTETACEFTERELV